MHTRTLAAGAALLTTAATCIPATLHAAADRTIPCTNLQTFKPYPEYAWMGSSNATEETVLSRQGACLDAMLYTPTNPAATVPAVVLEPGSGGTTVDLGWAARYLAGNGYEALVVVQQGQGGSEVVQPSPCTPDVSTGILTDGERLTQVCTGLPPGENVDNAVDAISSGIDWLLSPANPLTVNQAEIGAGGHSEGARGASAAQATDSRISAIVAFDNLTANYSGDQGDCSGGSAQAALTGGQIPGSSFPITPRVPAMGQACDVGKFVFQLPTSAKETSFLQWRGDGISGAELVFAGSGHLDWTGEPAESSAKDVEHQDFAYYMKAWFDLFLLGDQTGLTRLEATSISGMSTAADGATRASLLATDFTSALYVPASSVDCTDFQADCGA